MNSAIILALILHWKDADLTFRSVASLVLQKKVPMDIMVVDNSSEKNSLLPLIQSFPDVRFAHNGKNIGVASGRNMGIHFAIEHGYKYILLLDNDAFATPDMLLNLLNAAERNPNVGVFGPKILKDDDSKTIWKAGCRSWKWAYLHSGYALLLTILKLFGKNPPGILNAFPGQDQSDFGQHDTERDIVFQIGCAQFIRTEVFKQIGLLDEEFSPYGGEDIDFCERTKKAGWRILYVPKARCFHRIMGSYRDDYLRTFYNTRNSLLLARKHLPALYFWLLFFPDYLFLTFPLMVLKLRITRLDKSLKAFLDAIKWNIDDIRYRGLFITK